MGVGRRSFPGLLFHLGVGVVGLCLAASALYSVRSHTWQRQEYLRSRAHDIAAALDSQVRGSGRRRDPESWGQAFEETRARYQDRVAFIDLRDGENEVLARAGTQVGTPGAIDEQRAVEDAGLFVYELPLSVPQGQHFGEFHIAGWQIVVGLYASQADFIMREAYVHLAVAAVAISTLVILSLLLQQTFRRFLALKVQEESERHLTALGRMAATLAHEIRNPLGAMKGLTQVVQEQLPQDHRSQSLMKTVVKEALRLEQLVSDLLQFSKPRAIKMDTFSLRELLDDLESLLKSRLRENHVDLVVDVPDLRVHGDRDGLRQVLLNVMHNAVEAMRDGGTIDLQARAAGKPLRVIIEVGDTGPGLGTLRPEDLYEPFVTTKTQGSGLGLSVSRRIMERMGGSLHIENRAQGGARCRMEFPIKSTGPARPAEPRPARGGTLKV